MWREVLKFNKDVLNQLYSYLIELDVFPRAFSCVHMFFILISQDSYLATSRAVM